MTKSVFRLKSAFRLNELPREVLPVVLSFLPFGKAKMVGIL